ncbi:Pectin acetylesterase 8 [Sesamum alatum]|uniref:Pectin acetylesterase n=1 Tax=Sesamum alatum TaxID=300844 RepID=A0AAE1YPW4_9LAMI|nr:Pectin acetylesterase 8 [Sesamum alatum]
MEKHIQTTADHWIKLLVFSLVMITKVHGKNISITILHSAVSKGAVCLDGSPPAYFYDKGYGEGADNWVVYLEGGGWCANTFCLEWIKHFSTFKRSQQKDFRHILDPEQTNNPDFYNWNRVYVAYCDGSSFMGDVEAISPGTNLTRRGARIFDAVMEDLQAKGLKNAKNAILVGGSAGGMATIYHCDGFRALVPNASRYKCIADSGLFTLADKKDLIGYEKRVHRFDKLIAFHETDKYLPKSCTSKMSANLCHFPENVVRDIQTPLFIIESSYDSFQIQTGVEPGLPYNETTWYDCATELKFCTCPQIQSMKDFRAVFLKTLQEIAKSSKIGMFVHSCHTHGHFLNLHGWNPSPLLQNKTIAKVIGDWYFDRSFFQVIDTEDVEPKNCWQQAYKKD